MRALALDFDGVVSDSAPEAFAVALRTYVALRPESTLGSTLERCEALVAEAVRADPLYAGFVDRMPLGNRAEDFGVVLHSLEYGVEVADQAAYDAVRAALPQEFLERFHARFYAERDAFARAQSERWQSLLGPYPQFVSLLRGHAEDLILAIATAKDGTSVARLLDAYGIADLFDPGLVLDKETGVSKRAHLQALQARLGMDFRDITFVDDKVNHLEDVAPLGVRCALAAWGYNGPREADRARELGFTVCKLADAHRELLL